MDPFKHQVLEAIRSGNKERITQAFSLWKKNFTTPSNTPLLEEIYLDFSKTDPTDKNSSSLPNVPDVGNIKTDTNTTG